MFTSSPLMRVTKRLHRPYRWRDQPGDNAVHIITPRVRYKAATSTIPLERSSRRQYRSNQYHSSYSLQLQSGYTDRTKSGTIPFRSSSVLVLDMKRLHRPYRWKDQVGETAVHRRHLVGLVTTRRRLHWSHHRLSFHCGDYTGHIITCHFTVDHIAGRSRPG